jgi:hypothetical protein
MDDFPRHIFCPGPFFSGKAASVLVVSYNHLFPLWMTVFLPLEASTPFPSSPPFLAESTDTVAQVSKVLKAILKARRIVVICGAHSCPYHN